MQTETMGDEIDVSELAKRQCEQARPLCPQFHPCRMEGPYPVRGYCVLSCRPGRFMIPSIEEYGSCCTAEGFSRCPWFQGNGEPTGAVGDLGP